MDPINLKPGDVFCSSNPMWLGKAINALQWLWSKDAESTYSHAGMILDREGTTLESLWTVTSRNIFAAYDGDKVIFARPLVPESDINSALSEIRAKHEGQWYPGWRLLLHIIPPLSKIALFDRLVCSELTAKYLWLADARHGQYKGTNPDTLADEWRHWKNFDVIYEGVISTGD